NNGALLQVTRTDDGANGVVNLVLDGSQATGNISDQDDKGTNGATNFALQNNAQWTGALKGVDTLKILSGSSFIETGGAAGLKTLMVGDGVTVSFTNGVTLNQQFVAQGGTQASFSGDSILNKGVKVDGAGTEPS